MEKVISRKVPMALLVLSVLLIGVGFVIDQRPDLLGLCSPSSTVPNCLSEEIEFGIGKVLHKGLIPLPLVFLVLLFVPPKAFRAWAWFAIPYGIAATVFLLLQPAVSTNMFDFSRFEYARALSLLFALLSVVIVGYILFRERKRRSKGGDAADSHLSG